MNQQTKRIRVLAIVSLGLIMCCLCINPVYSKAPTTLEVCFHVGRIPLIDPECYPGAPIQPLLHDLFPAGQTTVADVHEAIGQYRVDSNATDFGGKLEVYRFQTKFLLPFEDTIVMKYDGNGLLLGWSVED